MRKKTVQKRTKKTVTKGNNASLWVWGVVIFFIVTMILTVLAYYRKPVANVSYKDPNNHFSITMPENWYGTANNTVSKDNVGKPNETTQTYEVVHLQSSENENVGVTVQVTEGKPSCDTALKPNTTLGGLPATFIPEQYRWKIYTTDATYSVSYFYPGTGNFHGPVQLVSPTPVPQTDSDAYHKAVMAVAGTFAPINKEPLNCQ